MRATRILILICLAALALPATASAAPVDNAGGSQYTPTIPGAGGPLEERDFGGSDEQTDANLPDAVTDELRSSGSSGATAAAAAAATTPQSDALERAKERLADQDDGARRGDQLDSLPIATAGLADGGSDRIGMLFPLALGLSLIVGLVLLVRRRRLDP